jgi:hypothetical protein
MYQSKPTDPDAPVAGPRIATVERPDEAGGATSILPGFLAELARAMQAAAVRERDRIAQIVAQDAAEHVEKARTMAAAEAQELSRLADADVARIKEWSKTEIERIRLDADRRTDERRKSLEVYLAKHESIIATEIGGVDVAIRRYRAELDRFFDELTGSTNPADIVRRADSLPTPPDLDEVRATARAGAVEELANVPDHDADEQPADEHGSGAEAVSAAPPDAVAGDEASPESEATSAEAGTGLGVMDPDAVGRSDDLPAAALDEDEAEAAPTSATAPPADALHVEADEGVEVTVPESPDHSNVALRLLRSIAPWTTQADDNMPENRAQAR